MHDCLVPSAHITYIYSIDLLSKEIIRVHKLNKLIVQR